MKAINWKSYDITLLVSLVMYFTMHKPTKDTHTDLIYDYSGDKIIFGLTVF